MRVGIDWGRQRSELEVLEKNWLPLRHTAEPAALADPVRAMRDALDKPYHYPPLWRALTPDDHVVVLVDEGIPQLTELLIALLEHVRMAGVKPDAITLLCLPPSSGQAWLDEFPDEFQDVRIEVHQPGDRRKLAYLATTKQGQRIYLNRSAVDADQLVVLTRRRFDPQVGYAGAECALYPALGDENSILENCHKLDQRAPDLRPWPLQQQAKEIAWLVGAPFFVQMIEGAGDTIENVLAGPLESSSEGERLLNARWRCTTGHTADVAIAGISGDPSRYTIDDMARAYFNAARVVKPGGSIVLFTEITPSLSRGFEVFRQHDDPSLALSMLHQEKTSDLSTCFMWARAASHARLYLLSGLTNDIAEELFTIPLQNPGQAQKLLADQTTCLLLPDAHKSLAVIG